jgi:hypothetical protein
VVHHGPTLLFKFSINRIIHLSHLIIKLLLVKFDFFVIDLLELVGFNLHLLDLQQLRPLLPLSIKQHIMIALFSL